jgi:hypothetical protein
MIGHGAGARSMEPVLRSETMLIPKSILFLTGGITIALEIVASRILTPYFGASLFVWTAILCVTLLSLAIGYALGGRLSRYTNRHVRLAFSCAPALAGVCLILAVLSFPILPDLAVFDIVGGAFIAATILLAPCLVLLSALNPLLVALPGKPVDGDAGSGSVFALSTVGSVMGALVASFALVPFLPTDQILLALVGILSACSVLAAVTLLARGPLLAALAPAALALLGAMVVLQTVSSPGAITLVPGLTAHRIATYRSHYGNVTVVDLVHDKRPDRRLIGYVQNGGLQGMIHADGRIASRYARVMVDGLLAYKPKARRVLVIGLATGMMPRAFDERGIEVDVVDINPNSPTIARRHFGFAPKRARIHILDARLFLSKCADEQYDAVLFDAFSGLDLPEHLLTVEAFTDAVSCLNADGLLLANLVLPPVTEPVTRAVLATVQAALPGPMHLFSLTDGARNAAFGNHILLAGSAVAARPPTLTIEAYPVNRSGFEVRTLAGESLDATDFSGSTPLTDRRNRFALLAAQAQIARFVFPFPVGW